MTKPPSQRHRPKLLPEPTHDPLYWEKSLWQNNYHTIAGLDEAGRGAWAGPVAAAAVVLKPGTYLSEVDDSKKLTPQKRDELYDLICAEAYAYSVVLIEPQIIDEINILQASLLAMKKSVNQLKTQPDYLLIDGNKGISLSIPQKLLVKGDHLSQSIAAASILAKVSRDRFMKRLEKDYPHFEFSRHKGYGTKQHRSEIQKYGYQKCHRQSFEPIRSMVEKNYC